MMIKRKETSFTKLISFQSNVALLVRHAFIDLDQSSVVFKHPCDAGSANFHTLKISAVFL